MIISFVQKKKNLHALFVQNSKLIHQKISLPAFMKILENIKQEIQNILRGFFVIFCKKYPLWSKFADKELMMYDDYNICTKFW